MALQRNCLFLFTDYYFATKAERILLDGGFSIQLVPTPKELSHACGLCLLAYEEDVPRIASVLVEAKITHSGLYRRDASYVKVTTSR